MVTILSGVLRHADDTGRLADLVRLTSDKTNRRINELQDETFGAPMNIQSDLTDVRQSLDLAGTVPALPDRTEASEDPVEPLKTAV